MKKEFNSKNIRLYIAEIFNGCKLYQVSIYNVDTKIFSLPCYFTNLKDAVYYYSFLKKQAKIYLLNN